MLFTFLLWHSLFFVCHIYSSTCKLLFAKASTSLNANLSFCLYIYRSLVHDTSFSRHKFFINSDPTAQSPVCDLSSSSLGILRCVLHRTMQVSRKQKGNVKFSLLNLYISAIRVRVFRNNSERHCTGDGFRKLYLNFLRPLNVKYPRAGERERREEHYDIYIWLYEELWVKCTTHYSEYHQTWTNRPVAVRFQTRRHQRFVLR